MAHKKSCAGIGLGVAVAVALVLLVKSETFRNVIDKVQSWSAGVSTEQVTQGADDLLNQSAIDVVPPTIPALPTLSDITIPDVVGGASTTVAPTGDAGTDNSAAAALQTLPIKGRAAETGYTREQFGAAWTDDNENKLGHNGCDTRNDILARDMTNKVYQDGGDCVLASGTLDDPYSGIPIHWTRGAETSAAVQIDHLVALSDAWQTGAQQLSVEQRINLANDPLNLLAADGPLNQQKSDSDAASWLPPNKAYRCSYVARQVSVKVKYGLYVTQAEHDAIAGVLASCPAQALPS